MLPWLFGVLLVLNLALFWWGRQHEIPIEPELPPVAEAPYQIRLLDQEAGTGAPLSADAPQTQQAVEPVTGNDGSAAPQEQNVGDSSEPTAPDEGAQPDPAPVIEHLGPPGLDAHTPKSPPVYFPDPDPSEQPAGDQPVPAQ